MRPRHDQGLIRQLGALFRLSAQMVAGLDQEEASVKPARPHTPALRQRQYFEAVVRNSPAAIVMLDLDQHILACNAAFEKLFGYAQAEIVGHDLDTLITTEATYSEAAAYTRQAMESLVHAVTRRRRNDGTVVEVELFGIPVSLAGEHVGAVALYEDITERKRTEAWLRLANTALESAANAIVVCDQEGRIIWTNPAFTHLTGYSAEEARGQTLRLIKSGKHDQAFYQKLWETILAGQVWYAETINRRKDGSLYVEEQTIAPVRDERGEISHFISIKQDVTARKQAEAEVQKAKDVAEAANRAKSTWLANMSHELRTPLNAIIGYSEILQDKAEDLGEVDQDFLPDLKKIRAASQHLLGLINELLGLAQIEAGRMEIALEAFDLAPMIEEVVATVLPMAEKNASTLEVHQAANIGAMWADRAKLSRALYHLVHNACKFTEHGTITLEATRETTEAGDRIIFRVSDTGIGMTAEQLARLFQPFMQADASTTRKYGGAGLGLALSRSFCQMMGGDITVKSEPGKGSTFTIRVPAEVRAHPEGP